MLFFLLFIHQPVRLVGDVMVKDDEMLARDRSILIALGLPMDMDASVVWSSSSWCSLISRIWSIVERCCAQKSGRLGSAVKSTSGWGTLAALDDFLESSPAIPMGSGAGGNTWALSFSIYSASSFSRASKLNKIKYETLKWDRCYERSLPFDLLKEMQHNSSYTYLDSFSSFGRGNHWGSVVLWRSCCGKRKDDICR